MMLLHTALWLMLGVAQAGAVAPPAAVQAPRPPDGESVLLWPKGAPGSQGKAAPESVNEREGVRRIASIHKPSLNVYLPAKGTGTGAAVIIMPGGGHRYLAIDNEGHAVARWLTERGVAAFVLKYRLAREEGSTYKVEEHALADALRAVRLVRSRAKPWGVDPARVGLLGFSAGGQLAALAALRFDTGDPKAKDPVDRLSARPAFQGLLYAGAPPADLALPKDTPPAFILTAADDRNPSKNALAMFGKLREGGADAELHIYAQGGHGFGMKDRPMPITAWSVRFREWLDDRGFLKPLAPTTATAPAPAPAPATAPAPAPAPVPASPPTELDRRFADTVRPFLDKYCLECHAGAKPKGDLDLRNYASLTAVVQNLPQWTEVRDKLRASDMPPKKATQPPAEDRNKVLGWIEAVRLAEGRKHAGDPGPVLAHRLSNAEYNYTIRDLTGVDIRPAREFPVDPANTAGFDNSGESLAMSPALMRKYLTAAREVASHLVLESEGIAFAPHPMLVETDRDKYCVQRIVDFYQQQNTDLSAYFRSAWQFKHRAALGKPRATLASLAADNRVSPKYLTTIWNALVEARESVGPLAKLQGMWRELPAPRRNNIEQATADLGKGSARMRDFVVGLRKKLEPRIAALAVQGMSATSQPLAMWRNKQYAGHRLTCDFDALQIDGKAAPARAAVAQAKGDDDEAVEEEEGPKAAERSKAADPDLAVPAAHKDRYKAAFARFCGVFPDRFYVSERGRNYLDPTRDKGRLLSAGFHNLMGYFRDDQPLVQLLLDDKQKAELDRMWREMDFVASTTGRTYVQFYFNGGGARTIRAARGGKKPADTKLAANTGTNTNADGKDDGGGKDKDKDTSDGAGRPADREVTSEASIKRVKDLFVANVPKETTPPNETARKAVADHFDWVNTTLRWTEQAHVSAEPKHLAALVAFAERGYRRPLSSSERDDLLGYYKSLRGKAGLDHEEAMRDAVVSVLMSPDFCYRLDKGIGGLLATTTAGKSAPAAARTTPVALGARPLSDFALASRLSYFLWSTLPDDELLAHARAGDLHRPKVLVAQARRMLKDARVRGMAVEFGGSWLDFRRFQEHNAVDRDRFPSFDDGLRNAMFEEPVRFMLDVFQQDRAVLDFLYADHTFVNPVLAKHYGMPAPAADKTGDGWVRVSEASRYGRGGLLPMAVFLTKNAPGLRTSPVKRGYWVVKNVLGERIPPPPAAVPELPRDEAQADLPMRQLLARHREDAACSGCHARFDAMGLVFEGYGPVGEQRSKDLAGRPVDASASFPGGSEASGLPGLRQYLKSKRQDDFVDNLVRKLLAYALGRTLILSDDTTVADIRARLAKQGHRFGVLVDSIVTSPQFLTTRTTDQVATR